MSDDPSTPVLSPEAPAADIPVAAAPPALPTTLDPLDRAEFVEADARAKLAAIGVRDAQQSLAAAARRVEIVNARIAARYAVGEGDTINPDTGVITRAAPPAAAK